MITVSTLAAQSVTAVPLTHLEESGKGRLLSFLPATTALEPVLYCFLNQDTLMIHAHIKHACQSELGNFFFTL